MGKNSAIEWTDHTWNPWRGGCTPRGPECMHCYARRDMNRYGHDPSVLVRSKTTFRAPLKWQEPARVFVCSWSDFFLEEADRLRPEAWEIMRQSPQHTYIIPTKRPELITDRLPAGWGDGWPNVWLLVSAGTQDNLDKWWGILRSVPAAVRGISMEPLLESVDPTVCLACRFYASELKHPRRGTIGGTPHRAARLHPRADWIIVGGESGPGARPMEITWAESLVEQCKAAGVPVFVKQLGTHWAKSLVTANGKTVYQLGDRKGSRMEYWPEDLKIREYPTGEHQHGAR